MIKLEALIIDAAPLGGENPMPDIKNVGYIHAGYEVTPRVSKEEQTYLGHGMIPTMLPYRQQDGYTREKKARPFRAAVLENEHLRAVFLPELGGRLWSLYDKDEGRDLLYVNPVFQPGNLALRNAWFSGGVEFNVGIKGHNPLTCSPVYAAVRESEEGEVLCLYEYERIRGVVYCVEAFLPENSRVLYLRPRIENRSGEEKHMYWWSNIAVPETKGTRVIVPTEESFLSSYLENHYLIDKISIPMHEGTDVSYPGNIPASKDFFYKIPQNEKKWIATADESGRGLLQCSTARLFGRKLFVWGQGQGGRHWNEWLSREGSAYIEIQAGLAHTQLEHIPMPPHSEWSWVEAYTAMAGDPARLHGDFAEAQTAVGERLAERVGDPEEMTFPEGGEIRILMEGSGYGALEESIRGEPISAYYRFTEGEDGCIHRFRELLEKGFFPAPDPKEEPDGYVTSPVILAKLEELAEQNWYSMLHIGVIRYYEAAYGRGSLADAEDAWLASLALCENGWAARNLAMLYKNEYKDGARAKEYLLRAYRALPDCRALAEELGALLTATGDDLMWVSLYEGMPDTLRNVGRIRLLYALALLHLDRLDEAREIVNPDFAMPDIKEGELSVSALWFMLYRRLFARENGIPFREDDRELAARADEVYPLPKSLDFRMH